MATQKAVVFSGRNGLDFSELRASVLRIPEVTVRIRQAQSILDTLDLPKVDLFNVIASDDELFFRNIKLKSLSAAVVQIGLFDRLCKTQRRPEFMIGNSNGDSAMMVCAGLQSFDEMVRASQAADTAPAVSPTNLLPMSGIFAAPLLAGLSLTEFRAAEAVQTENGLVYMLLPEASMEIKKVAQTLHQDRGVNRFISIGPAGALRLADYKDLGTDEVESLDSIELDPMLGWFWKSVRPQAAALA
jgi:hypothetical protein